MTDGHRRYSFPPLERRGVLLGLEAAQIVTLLAGVAGALVIGHLLPAPLGAGAALLLLVGLAASALWRRAGRPLVCWLPVALAWAVRRRSNPRLLAEPLAGRSRAGTRSFSAARSGQQAMHAGIDLVEVEGSPGGDPLGLIHDHRSGSWAAVVPVNGRSFVLLDPDDQVGQLEAWQAVLGTLARRGTPLRRVQWIHRSLPVTAPARIASPDSIPSHDSRARQIARESYDGLLADVGLASQSHQAWMVLAVGGPRRPAGLTGRPLDGLCREVRLLDGHLRNAGLRAGSPLRLDALRDLIGVAHRDALAAPGSRGNPWPAGTDEGWSVLRADGLWHATFWISEWPRVDVNPDFLTALLLCDGRRTVSVVMAPMPADRAAREARAARAADAADEELRHRAGFLPSARRHREAEGVLRRESELADGHAEYRFSGYVTVSAGDRDGLEAACVQTEQAAQRAHLELRRLYGRQVDAYTWTLPLARGLA